MEIDALKSKLSECLVEVARLTEMRATLEGAIAKEEESAFAVSERKQAMPLFRCMPSDIAPM